MAAGDLTTLQHVKDWLGISDANSDVLLARLITSASRFILGYLNRDTLAASEYAEIYDGYGNNFMMLRQWPIVAMASIEYCGITINTPSTGNPRTNGYILEAPNTVAGGQQRLTLWGYCFPRGKASIMINYTAGYQNVEQYEVPANPGPYTVVTNSLWLGDGGVTYVSTGLPLELVNGAPGPGQYTVSTTGTTVGTYTFNAADAGAGVMITYSFVPEDIEQATYEMVGERFKYKSRIGENSKSLGGQETVSFSQKDMSDFVETLLNPYRRVVPV